MHELFEKAIEEEVKNLKKRILDKNLTIFGEKIDPDNINHLIFASYYLCQKDNREEAWRERRNIYC